MTIAHTYETMLDALPENERSKRLGERPGFEAVITYTPSPDRDMILTFADGSVYSYEQRWAFSREEWADLDKSVGEYWGADLQIKVS